MSGRRCIVRQIVDGKNGRRYHLGKEWTEISDGAKSERRYVLRQRVDGNSRWGKEWTAISDEAKSERRYRMRQRVNGDTRWGKEWTEIYVESKSERKYPMRQRVSEDTRWGKEWTKIPDYPMRREYKEIPLRQKKDGDTFWGTKSEIKLTERYHRWGKDGSTELLKEVKSEPIYPMKRQWTEIPDEAKS